MGEIFKKFQSFDIDYVDYYCNGRRKWREKTYNKVNAHFNF